MKPGESGILVRGCTTIQSGRKRFGWLLLCSLVYSHTTSGTEDFADSPPSLAPSAATQAPSPSPVPDMQAPTPSPASPSSSRARSVILPPTLGREIAAEPSRPPPATGTPSTSSPAGSSPSVGPSSPKPTVSASPALRPSGTLNTNGSLTVNFKEASLGANQLITYALTADATATYVCVKSGGDKAQNKTTVAGPVSASGTFTSGTNGDVTASLTVAQRPSDISCPPKQSLELASVSYTNVVLTDTTNDVTIEVGDFSSGCLLPNVKGAC
jgi:hypothetical protein